FCWRKEPKGQYFDRHEQANVVDYCQKIYKPIIVWLHNESILFANDRQLVHWVGTNKHPTPFKKGEGNTIMIADF
ncbi:hypothetical protein B0J17DRAFT_532399, partial [Rhizoctonia solani]